MDKENKSHHTHELCGILDFSGKSLYKTSVIHLIVMLQNGITSLACFGYTAPSFLVSQHY